MLFFFFHLDTNGLLIFAFYPDELEFIILNFRALSLIFFRRTFWLTSPNTANDYS